MKIRGFILFAAFILSISFCSGSFAEVIYLKSGKVAKGKIVEEGPYYIIVDEDGVPRKYFDGQIDRIEEDSMDTSKINFDQFQEMGLSVEKAKLIVTMMNISGVRGSMQKSVDEVIAGVPQEQRSLYENIFNIEEIIERLIPLYDKYYSAADVQNIIAFYQSSAGQRAFEVTPQIMEESVEVLIKYVQEKTQP